MKEIKWQISRRGKLTPVIYIEQININGILVKKASGHNAKYIKDYQIGKNSIIGVVRSGEVIPYVEKVIKSTLPDMPDFPYYWKDENDIYV